ncbi:MAG: CotH kinase family protein [Bacteroidota bacterium]
MNGNLVLNQNVGLRIHGGASRAAPQKSLRLYAREEYGDSLLSYPFFSQKPELQEFETVILRSARDWSYVLFKDELCQSLVEDMNIDNMATEPVVVFVNGEYWGIHSFHERQDKQYIKNHHFPAKEHFDIIAYEAGFGLEVDEGTFDNYSALLEYLETHDVSDNDVFEEVSQMIDIDNCIDFFIAQMYFANSDFPKKNLKMWRPSNPDSAQWRYFFFDCDGCMIRVNYNHLDEYNNTFEDIQQFPSFSMVVLRNLMKNKRFRQMFATRFYYHLNTTFTPETVLEKIEEYEKIYTPLAAEHTLRWRLPEDVTKWEHNVTMLKQFAVQRPAVIHQEIIANFGVPFFVYPNPIVQGSSCEIDLYSENVDCEALSLNIVNINGNSVYSLKTNTCELSSQEIKINWNPGIYFVQWRYQNVQFITKLIVQ